MTTVMSLVLDNGMGSITNKEKSQRASVLSDLFG